MAQGDRDSKIRTFKKDGIRRVSQAGRYVERLMRGNLDPQLRPTHPTNEATVRVQTVRPNTSASIPSKQGYYPGRFTFYDTTLMAGRPHLDDDGQSYYCLLLPMNREEGLAYPATKGDLNGTVYVGRIVGYYIHTPSGPTATDPSYENWQGVPVVEVVGVEQEESGSGGDVIIPVPINLRCDEYTEDFHYEIMSIRLRIVDGKLVSEVIE